MSSPALKSCLKKPQPADNSTVPKQVRFAVSTKRDVAPSARRSAIWRTSSRYVSGKYADRSGAGYENTSDPFEEPDCEYVEVDITQELTAAEIAAMTPEELEARMEAQMTAMFEVDDQTTDIDGETAANTAANKYPVVDEDVEMTDDSDLDALSSEELQAQQRALEARLALFQR